MNDSEVSELLQIYDNVLLKNLSYCSICLRVEDERRLVPPKAIMQLIQALDLSKDYGEENRPVCYMCEALAASAIRFHTIVRTSLSMHSLFHKMLLRKRFENQVRACMKKHQGVKIAQNALHKTALECEMQLKAVRAKCRLQQTDVLVIDCYGMKSANEPSENNDPLVVTLQNIIPGPGMETVVILDDEDEPKVIKPPNNENPNVTPEQFSIQTPKLVPIERLLESTHSAENIASILPNQMQVMQPDKDLASSYMLHPIVIESDGSFNVPSLSAKLLNGRLIYQENTNPLPLASPNNLVGSHEKSTIMIGNQEKTSISVGAQNKSTDMVVNSTVSTILVGNGDKSVGNFDNIPSVVIKEGSVTCLSDVERALQRILKEKGDELTNNYKRSHEGINGKNKKRAIETVNKESEKEKESKIDWEDKIPMDVISFMDAVDPHADPVLRLKRTAQLLVTATSDGALTSPPAPAAGEPGAPQASAAGQQGSPQRPLVVISEVRSVSATNNSTQTTFETADVIDLC